MAKKITELPEITADNITADDVMEVSHKDEEIFISKKMKIGIKANINPLNHDRYTDAEAVAAAKTVKLDDFTTPDDTTDLDATTSLHGLMPKADKTKLDGIEAGADITDAVNIASSIHGVDSKATPIDADELGLIDSAASNALKKLTWANLKATLLATDGYVFYNGSITLDGQNGVTVTHNKGNTNYIVKVMPKDNSLGMIGEISVIKSANTCVIYNTGIGSIAADVELSNI